MPKKITIIALALITLVAVGGAAVVLYTTLLTKEAPEAKLPQPSTVTAPTPPEIDTTDWKVYRNEKYGFEVRYPGNWRITREDERVNPRSALTVSFKDFISPPIPSPHVHRSLGINVFKKEEVPKLVLQKLRLGEFEIGTLAYFPVIETDELERLMIGYTFTNALSLKKTSVGDIVLSEVGHPLGEVEDQAIIFSNSYIYGISVGVFEFPDFKSRRLALESILQTFKLLEEGR